MAIRPLLSDTPAWRNDLDTRAAVQEILNLKDRDQYLEAGIRAYALLEAGVLDLRVLGIVLYSDFLTHQLDALPDLFQATLLVLTRHWEGCVPVKQREKHLLTTLRWLLARVRKGTVDRAEETSGEWPLALGRWTPASRQSAYDALHRLRRVLLERFDNDELQGHLAVLLDWLEEMKRFRSGPPVSPPAPPAPISAPKVVVPDIPPPQSPPEPLDGWDDPVEPEPEPLRRPAAPMDDDDGFHEEDFDTLYTDPGGDDELELEAFSQPLINVTFAPQAPKQKGTSGKGKPPGAPPVASATPPRPEPARVPPPAVPPARADSEGLPVFASAPLRALQRKLQAFEQLVASRQLVLAAILNEDIQQELEHFEPLRYLPELFANYYALQVEHMRGLVDAQHHLAREPLARLLQVDPARFLRTKVREEP